MKKTLCTLSLAILGTISTQAATLSWDGDAGAPFAWNTAANWNPDQTPSGTDNLTVGSGQTAALGSVFTITSGTLSVDGTVNLSAGGEFSLSNSGNVSVTIAGELNLTTTTSYLNSNVNNNTQSTFRLDGGTINISNWNNTLRSIGNATTGIGFEFMQAGDTIDVSEISAADQSNYTGKFSNSFTFFGLRGSAAIWSPTANGLESQVVDGFQLLRVDDFTNNSSMVTLVAVPEPTSTSLLGLASLGLLLRRRR